MLTCIRLPFLVGGLLAVCGLAWADDPPPEAHGGAGFTPAEPRGGAGGVRRSTPPLDEAHDGAGFTPVPLLIGGLLAVTGPDDPPPQAHGGTGFTQAQPQQEAEAHGGAGFTPAEPRGGAGGVRRSTPPLDDDPVLVVLVAEALTHNPDLLAAQQSVLASRLRVPQAEALPDPMLSVGYTNDGWSPSLGRREMTTLAVMASQDLPFPGKRRLRSDIASREAGQVEQQLERARLRLVAEVKRAYLGLLLARELQALVQEQREVWGQIEGVVRARYAVGQGAQQDVLRVQVELTRVEEREAEQAAEADIRLAELNRLLDRSAEQPLETAAKLVLRPIATSLAEALTQARARSPELVSARLAAERNRLGIRLAQKELKPDFALQAGYMNRGGLDPMWQAGIGVTLPIYRKKRAAVVAEAEARVRGDERLLDSIDLQLRYRTQERVTRLKTSERIAALYDNGIIPQDRMSVEAAIANYQTGKLPFVAVLDALTTLYGDRWTHARLVADHARLLASLEEASLEPTEGMPAGAASTSSGAPGGGMGGR